MPRARRLRQDTARIKGDKYTQLNKELKPTVLRNEKCGTLRLMGWIGLIVLFGFTLAAASMGWPRKK
jgi:hypothetical protein